MSVDPIGRLGGGRTQGYSANPIRGIDPLGLAECGVPSNADANRSASNADWLKELPDPYGGVKQASAYLKSMGVDRATRTQILQSFDVSTLSVEKAGDNLFGLRFHDFGETARPLGSYLFETFTPQINRAGLALPYEWNGMTGIQQWQVVPGTTYLKGLAAPQLQFGPQYTGGAEQMFVLQPWKYGSLR